MTAPHTPRLTIVIPVLDEIERLPDLLSELRDTQSEAHVVVADGGSCDGSLQFARAFCHSHANRFRLVQAEAGRARQMNRAAELVESGWILFLHADTRLPDDTRYLLDRAWRSGCLWGRFDVSFDTPHRSLNMVAWFMNARSHLTGIATGDQAIFVRADTFAAVDRYPPIPLMEDIALSKALRSHSRPCRLRTPVTTSARRWQQRGVLRTILAMWGLRFAYWAGVAPEWLVGRYHRVR